MHILKIVLIYFYNVFNETDIWQELRQELRIGSRNIICGGQGACALVPFLRLCMSHHM